MKRKKKSIYQQPYTNKKNKKQSKLLKRTLGIFIILAFCTLLFTGMRAIWGFLFNRYDTVEVAFTSWGNQYSCQALILEDAFVDVAPLSGTIELQAEEAQQIQSGDCIATIVDQKKLAAKDEQLAKVQTQLTQVENEVQSCVTMQVDVTVSAKEQLRSWINQFVLSKGSFDFSGMSQAYTEIKKSATKYQNIVREDMKVMQNRDELKAQVERLEQERASLFTSLLAGKAGTISYRLDGLEAQLSLETLPLTNVTDIWKEAEVKSIESGNQVTQGQKLYKTIGDAWYLLVRIPVDAVPVVSSSQELRCIWQEKTLVGTILYTQTDHEYGYLYFKMEEPPLIGRRLLNVNLQTEQKEGYEIPKTALRYENELTYVYTQEGKVSVKIPVEIVAEDVENVLVTGLKEGILVVEDANRLGKQ